MFALLEGVIIGTAKFEKQKEVNSIGFGLITFDMYLGTDRIGRENQTRNYYGSKRFKQRERKD